jgi:hypothetical protein
MDLRRVVPAANDCNTERNMTRLTAEGPTGVPACRDTTLEAAVPSETSELTPPSYSRQEVTHVIFLDAKPRAYVSQ